MLGKLQTGGVKEPGSDSFRPLIGHSASPRTTERQPRGADLNHQFLPCPSRAGPVGNLCHHPWQRRQLDLAPGPKDNTRTVLGDVLKLECLTAHERLEQLDTSTYLVSLFTNCGYVPVKQAGGGKSAA